MFRSGRALTPTDAADLLLRAVATPRAPSRGGVVRLILGFDTALDAFSTRALKTDLRPAYGVLFEEYLDGYDFWGHCDLDVLFGRIRDHLPPAARNDR